MPKQTFFNLPEEKRQTILEIATDEFAENEYNSASISQVVARAGISKGSFYQYFEDKQDLYLFLIQQMAEEKKRYFTANPPPDDKASIFEMLRWMFRVGLDFQFMNPRLARIGFRAVFEENSLPAELHHAIRASGVDFYRQLVNQGIAQGDIDATYDPELVVFVLNAIMTQLDEYLLRRLEIAPTNLLDQGARALDKPGFDEIIDQLIEILKDGFGQKESIEGD